ncbi:hypothetical protein KP509_24G032000 [Ceratopteris richardii]|uniref:RING-type E3 ubiquitin transferase n=1 Tax=Ceratopteris richardii TaxID=49495 RepID=A0A8T2RTR1_CERRI|nr:hypothetical protein KP509_24G032000 [Ceratopteris richardii]
MMTMEHEEGGVADQRESGWLIAASSSAAAFVEGGIQDSCHDLCSICLEPFSSVDPATVTTCNHEYHLQCVLEWAQRSRDCPMCLQRLTLNNPTNQQLLEAYVQEQGVRHDGWVDTHVVEASNLPSYTYDGREFRECVAHQFSAEDIAERHILFVSQHQSTARTRPYSEERYNAEHEPSQGVQERWSSFNDSQMKSRFLAVSTKCKEIFTRTTHGFKERFCARMSDAGGRFQEIRTRMSDAGGRFQEINTDALRQTLRRVTPAVDEIEEIPLVSTENGSFRKVSSLPNRTAARPNTQDLT